MSATTFWILFLAPAVVLVVLRVARQGRGYRLAYLGRLESSIVKCAICDEHTRVPAGRPPIARRFNAGKAEKCDQSRQGRLKNSRADGTGPLSHLFPPL